MTVQQFLSILSNSPIIASVQADAGTPLADPKTLTKLAQASLKSGSKILRMQGIPNILEAESLGAPIIGLIKNEYPNSEVYITPTRQEVEQLLVTKCPVIAIDATIRNRPNGEKISDLCKLIHLHNRLVLADIDSAESAQYAAESGADILSTTLSGYTTKSIPSEPNIDLIREIQNLNLPVLAEGRYAETWQAQAAIQAGASGVVIGGVLNDPIKQTRKFARALSTTRETIGCVDLGGTWLRFATLSPTGNLENITKISAPKTHQERIEFILNLAQHHKVKSVGISAGGTIDPKTSTITETKGFIPDYLNKSFDIPGLEIMAINDGLATAWGHALHPSMVGKKIATLALGTGVGAGIAHISHLDTDLRGNYPRWNDLQYNGSETIEEKLGGLALTTTPSQIDQFEAIQVAQYLIEIFNSLFVDEIVLAGGISHSPWFQSSIPQFKSRIPISLSPYGENAGLFGAALLAKFPPPNIK